MQKYRFINPNISILNRHHNGDAKMVDLTRILDDTKLFDNIYHYVISVGLQKRDIVLSHYYSSKKKSAVSLWGFWGKLF